MNIEDRVAFIRRSMLQILSDCSPYCLPQNTFFAQLNMAVVPALTLQEFETELRWLESNHFTVGVRGDLGGAVKWKITSDGKAVLAS